MKTNKLLYAALIAGATLGTATSCSDSFLDENLITEKGTAYFQTKDGIDDLVTGAYQKLKFKYNYIWGIYLYGMGIDEFTSGGNNITSYNAYGTDLNSSETAANQRLWDNMYGLVEPANMIIQNTPLYYGEKVNTYNNRLGEGYFLRAFAYFELVKQYGGVPLKLESSNDKINYTYTRNSEEECFAQIISDFEKAYELLPEKPEDSQLGRLTKSAAAHFLAKTHLYRASELHDSWNSNYKNADLEAVIKYGKEVIAAHPLCSNFQELWDYTEPNGANEKVSEVVLAAQFSNDGASTRGRFGNQFHLYYPSIYQNLAGCKRDISGGREFSYVSATEYSMQVFDRVNDSRFWKSFITKYGANYTDGAPYWITTKAKDKVNKNDPDVYEITDAMYKAHPEYYPDDVKVPTSSDRGDKRFKGGEIGIKYIVNNPGDTRFTPALNADGSENKSEDYVLKDGKLVPQHTFVRYYAGQNFSFNTQSDASKRSGNYYITGSIHNRSVALSKFRDGARESIASQFGTRDAIIARSADDVLMVAEAYIRKKDYANAITYLNMVRDRAGYKAGEDRSISRDGGQAYKKNSACTGKGGGFSAEGAIYTEENTYYESNNIAETTASTESNMHLNSIDDVLNSEVEKPIYEALSCSSDYDKFMCFLLDERTRELIGEGQRWEDLARTKTLEARWKAFSDASTSGQGSFDPAKHYYRPIPQSFLDGITNANGASLSNEEKEAMQNPGY